MVKWWFKKPAEESSEKGLIGETPIDTLTTVFEMCKIVFFVPINPVGYIIIILNNVPELDAGLQANLIEILLF